MTTCPHCGCDTEEEPSKKHRSVPQNRRLHALCRALYNQWPHDSEVFRPKSTDHMRYWLISQVEGYFDVLRTIRVSTTDPMLAYNLLKLVLEESDAENIFIELDGNQIIRKRAHSIAFDEMDHYAATKLMTEIDHVVETHGFNAYQVLKEAGKAA